MPDTSYLSFLLHDLFGLDDLLARPRHEHLDATAIDGVLDLAENLARDRFAPLAEKMDAQEPHFDGKTVRTPDGVGQALDAYREAGFFGTTFDLDEGGLQTPHLVAQAAASIFMAANVSLSAYPLLTVGAANLERAHADPKQKRRYMRRMVEGRFFGTMCLSEPQAGSSLADIRTRAEPQDDGSYRLYGAKMWISGADHDLADNIIHHVLAKIPGGPPGVKGISLFITPKYLLDNEGKPAARNDVHVAGLNHKMGYRGTVNAALNFGETHGAVGFLVGEPHQGLKYMFHMMNEARIGVGTGAAALAYEGYRRSAAYARERLQGRPASEKDPSSPPVAIIRHADVRRMLLAQKAYAEGALLITLCCARLVDELETGSAEGRAAAQARLDLLTPAAKTFPSEYGCLANSLAIQTLGGYGYARDHGVERLYRDNRLNPIHEGTTGVQGLDLLGRKILGDQGAALAALFEEVRSDAAAAADAFPDQATALIRATRRFEAVIGGLGARMADDGVEIGLSGATPVLDAFGVVTVTWLLLRQAVAARRSPRIGAAAAQGALAACRYMLEWETPRALGALDGLTKGAPVWACVPDDAL